ncbi:MAG: nickel pincer cofactor biosynthesis protein LarB, partial [Candidatus Omnitrophota bacterium]
SPKSSFVMATRADRRAYNAVKKIRKDAVFCEEAGIIFAGKKRKKNGKTIAIVTAGTSDIPVAEEAAATAELMGNPVERIYDVGVAGIHRLLGNKKNLLKANVVIVCAGMEGALASIVGGVVEKPVIAVPTSVGYGANFSGLAPLLTMLNSCSPGVAVVNIDNGFGAGYMASLINTK